MAKQVFKLTDNDKKYLLSIGQREEDLTQIEQAFNEVSLSVTDNNIIIGLKTRPCKQKRAIEVIGRETFLSGLSRAAFHASATRVSGDGRFEVHFDLFHWWR